jgi:hypothetical protein
LLPLTFAEATMRDPAPSSRQSNDDDDEDDDDDDGHATYSQHHYHDSIAKVLLLSCLSSPHDHDRLASDFGNSRVGLFEGR